MYFKQFYEKGLSHYSYMIGCQATGEAIVIDPKRDIGEYLDTARSEKLRITKITETHIHADFVSGSLQLKNASGAELLLSDEGGEDWHYEFDHTGLKEGDEFNLGNINFKVMHTPGHTPEHISFIVTDTAAGVHPSMFISGDFVFVGDVGRPDLLEKAAGIKNTQIAGAKQMFRSLKKFKSLPDHLIVFPAHGAGSACGKSLGAVPSSTVGYEKLTNPALQITDEKEFIDYLLADQPEPPKYFGRMKIVNKMGPEILADFEPPKQIDYFKFRELLKSDHVIVDTRPKEEFAEAHISGTINIQDNSSFTTWAGWVLGSEKPIVLISGEGRIKELANSLRRIGLDNIAGYFGGFENFLGMGNKFNKTQKLTADELYERLSRQDITLIDVRERTEIKSGKIPGSINIFAGYINDQSEKLPSDSDIILFCSAGDRSSIAASILNKKGFSRVFNLEGGFNAWLKNGMPVETDANIETSEA